MKQSSQVKNKVQEYTTAEKKIRVVKKMTAIFLFSKKRPPRKKKPQNYM